MKVIVQIPCYNEEKTLPLVMHDMPHSIPGVDELETLVIDDGSTDRTVEVAHALGVNHVVRHAGNKGLAAAFQTGLDACLRLGADVIVNTDGDNQYPQEMIPQLIAPILRGEADMVVGDRQVGSIEHFSPVKKMLQAMGSWVVRQASGTTVPDAPSGFRALSREAALRLSVLTKYTYTLETIVQAGKKNISIASVPVRTNTVTRPSRLVRGLFDYVKKSSATILRIYALYEPLKVFFYVGGILLLLGVLGWVRVMWFWAAEEHMNFRATFSGHLPSVIFAVLALVVGFQIWLIGLVADLIASSRRLIEDTLYRVKRMELEMFDLQERGQMIVERLNGGTDQSEEIASAAESAVGDQPGLQAATRASSEGQAVGEQRDGRSMTGSVKRNFRAQTRAGSGEEAPGQAASLVEDGPRLRSPRPPVPSGGPPAQPVAPAPPVAAPD